MIFCCALKRMNKNERGHRQRKMRDRTVKRRMCKLKQLAMFVFSAEVMTATVFANYICRFMAVKKFMEQLFWRSRKCKYRQEKCRRNFSEATHDFDSGANLAKVLFTYRNPSLAKILTNSFSVS
jgi:hypothetical protein